MDEVARDFANYINAKSINYNREYSAAIYSSEMTYYFTWWLRAMRSIDTIKISKTKYTYNEPIKGTANSSKVPNALKFKEITAIAHTHAAYDSKSLNDKFSSADIYVADKLKLPNYVATPLETLRKYDPLIGMDIELFNDLPFDPNHPSR